VRKVAELHFADYQSFLVPQLCHYGY
jgi:hypothetical protein